MAEDFALPVRRAILPRLKESGELTSLVPAASIYPGKAPAGRPFPFIRYEAPQLSPFRASGLNSSRIVVTISAFTKPLYDTEDGVMIESAEDRIYKIGSAIKDALDDTTLPLDNGMKVRLSWTRSIPRQDSIEADAWGTGVYLTAEVAG